MSPEDIGWVEKLLNSLHDQPILIGLMEAVTEQRADQSGPLGGLTGRICLASLHHLWDAIHLASCHIVRHSGIGLSSAWKIPDQGEDES